MLHRQTQLKKKQQAPEEQQFLGIFDGSEALPFAWGIPLKDSLFSSAWSQSSITAFQTRVNGNIKQKGYVKCNKIDRGAQAPDQVSDAWIKKKEKRGTQITHGLLNMVRFFTVDVPVALQGLYIPRRNKGRSPHLSWSAEGLKLGLYISSRREYAMTTVVIRIYLYYYLESSSHFSLPFPPTPCSKLYAYR